MHQTLQYCKTCPVYKRGRKGAERGRHGEGKGKAWGRKGKETGACRHRKSKRRNLFFPDRVGAVLCVHPGLKGGHWRLHHYTRRACIPIKAHIRVGVRIKHICTGTQLAADVAGAHQLCLVSNCNTACFVYTTQSVLSWCNGRIQRVCDSLVCSQ